MSSTNACCCKSWLLCNVECLTNKNPANLKRGYRDGIKRKGFCAEVKVSACSNLFSKHASCITSFYTVFFLILHVSHLYLVSLSSYTIPMVHVYNIIYIISLWKGASPIIMQMPVIVMVVCMRTKFHVLTLAILKSEEVKAWSYLLFKQYVVVMETVSYMLRTNFHLHECYH